MKPVRMWLLGICCCILGALEAEDAALLLDTAETLPDEFDGKPLLFIPLVADAPKELKGDLSHGAWKNAAVFKLSGNQTGLPATYNSEARVFCTADALFVGVRFDDPDPDNLATTNALAFNNDCFELFLFPGEDMRGKLYHQIVIDAANREYRQQTHVYPKHGNRVLYGKWEPKLEHATEKYEKGWSAELKIKFADLSLPKGMDDKSSPWRLNLYRTRPPRGADPEQDYAWSPTMSASNHTPGKFGYVLPAPFCSEALIKLLSERAAAASGPQSARDLSAQEMRDITTLIAALGHEEYPQRMAANDRLLTLIKDRMSQQLFIEEELRKAESSHDDTEIRVRARRMLQHIRDLRSPDDDPPPPNAAGAERGE